MAMLIISSKESYENLSRAVRGAVSWMTGSAEFSYGDAEKKVMQQSETSLIVYGGVSENALKLVTFNPLEQVYKWVQEKSTPETIKYGIPISYRVNYLKDNQIARLSFTTDYKRVQTTGIPQLTDWKIQFLTTSDDKDDDSILTVTLLGPAGETLAYYVQQGKKTYDDWGNDTEVLTQSNAIYARDIPRMRLRINISPNGNDTWRFKYVLSARNSNGSEYRMTSDEIELKEEGPRRTYETTLR